MQFVSLQKLKKGDKVAVLSPSFAAPAKWPQIYDLGCKRLNEVFKLRPVEFPSTKKLYASKEERARDLINAFENKEIKAVIASLGGDDQVTYVKNLPSKPFINNPKPFFGYSDNTHFENFLWINRIPSFYGATLFTQFAEQTRINDYTLKYLRLALFKKGEFEISAGTIRSDSDLDWDNPENLNKKRPYESNDGWVWYGENSAEGITWGGCLESIDELLRHGISMPSLEDFENVILLTETSEEIPSANYTSRIYRALGERGILERIKGVFVGRPKAQNIFIKPSLKQKENYRKEQRKIIFEIIRKYNKKISIIQNMDFGHTDPQIPVPFGSLARIDSINKKIFLTF